MGRAAPKGLALDSLLDVGAACAASEGDSVTVRFARLSRGRLAGAAGTAWVAADGDDGTETSGVAKGDFTCAGGGSGFIPERH